MYLRAKLIQCMRSELVAVSDVNKANLSRTAVLALVMSKIKGQISISEKLFQQIYFWGLSSKKV